MGNNINVKTEDTKITNNNTKEEYNKINKKSRKWLSETTIGNGNLT